MVIIEILLITLYVLMYGTAIVLFILTGRNWKKLRISGKNC